MQICFLNNDLRDDTGAGRFCLNLIMSLKKVNPLLEVKVLTAVGSGHPWEEVIIPAHKLGMIFALPKIRRILKNFDIIHALDGYPYGVIAVLASLGLKKKIIITAIGTGAIQPLYRWYGFLLGWAYRRANAVVAISGYTRREILKKVPGLDITMINHAVEAEEFQGNCWQGVNDEHRERIENLKPYMFSVGAAKGRKGFEYSIRAYSLIIKRIPQLNYLILGTGGVTVENLVCELGLKKRITFIRHVPRAALLAMYRNAELFMLLPHEVDKDVEGFGFVFLEAAAAGLAVVGTLNSGAEDAVRDGKNGYLVPPRDPQAAAAAALKILKSSELREKFSEHSLEFAAEMNWRRVAEHYLKIYKELAPNR